VKPESERDALKRLGRFAVAAEKFGIPPEARLEFMERIQIAVATATAASTAFTLTPSERADRLSVIANLSRTLLEKLGAEDGHLPPWAGPLALALSRQRVSLVDLVGDLRQLAEMAQLVAKSEEARKKPGRGGARREGPELPTALLYELFALYDAYRRRFPQSGPPIGFSLGGPLYRFVDAVFATIEFDAPSGKAVGSAFDRWRELNSSADLF
jgi:hypothetical protein